jgi:hypothetical protein
MQFSHLYSSALDAELGTNDSTQLFTDSRRKTAINQAHLHWCDLTECAVRQSTIPCSNGVGEYNLISTVNVPGQDFLRIAQQQPEFQLISSGSSASTQFVAGDDFPRREINWLNQNDPGWRGSTGATPAGWYERMDGGKRLFGLVPPPRVGSSEVGKVLISYVAKPSSMTASTDVPFTFNSTVREDLEPYHQALVHYAASELEKLRLNTTGMQAQLQLFNGYLARFFRSQDPKGPRVVRTARNYFWDVRSRRGLGRDDRTPWPTR